MRFHQLYVDNATSPLAGTIPGWQGADLQEAPQEALTPHEGSPAGQLCIGCRFAGVHVNTEMLMAAMPQRSAQAAQRLCIITTGADSVEDTRGQRHRGRGAGHGQGTAEMVGNSQVCLGCGGSSRRCGMMFRLDAPGQLTRWNPKKKKKKKKMIEVYKTEASLTLQHGVLCDPTSNWQLGTPPLARKLGNM